MGKIITVLGTRPELIRLALIIKELDKLPDKHILVHTGQNYDSKLNDIFFEELGIRQPDYYLGAQGSLGNQMAIMFPKLEYIIEKENPTKALVLGDTNSGLTTILFERLGIKTFHMEAGNRCFDLNVPEEVNRRLIDSIASYNLPYTPGSRENLLMEGKDKNKVIVTGNPIYEVLSYYKSKITESPILSSLKLEPYKYFLSTFHRAETVDNKPKLIEIVNGLKEIHLEYGLPIICSVHPRTRSALEKFNINHEGLTFLEPLGFFDFVHLELYAKCVLSDSGTVSEETCILRTPNVIIRDSTERPETIECGSSILSGVDANRIKHCARIMCESKTNWEFPIGYIDHNVSGKVIKILLSKLGGR